MKAVQGGFLKRPGEGKTYTIGGTPIVYKVRAAETGSRFEITESTLPPDFGGVPAHVHQDTDHAFYVLEGQLAVQIGGEVYSGGPGTCVFSPRGMGHAFSNAASTPCRFLQIDSGSGREPLFEELARAFPGDSAIDRDVVGKILARYDTQPVSPRR
jgi:mannose-6-phosphate isomerase-like protein (cupin superfamily)